MNKIKVFISGQKYFGQEVLRLCMQMEGVEVVGVCAPLDDRYITDYARVKGIPVIAAGTLNADTLPEGVDLGITAHSFDYIGKKTRYKARLGWIGYHPSLLPRHRGRDSIEWAIRMRDIITGGTVYWLNAGIDRGDIAYQEWCWIPPKYYLSPKDGAKRLWRDELSPIGLKLFKRALNDIKKGIYKRYKQRNDVSTYEPSLDRKDIFRPDLLMIEDKSGCN